MKNYETVYFPESLLTELDQRFLVNGELQLLPSSAYSDVPHEILVWWCMKRGYFVLPTVELIEWLKTHVIKDRIAIEICAGKNNLGRYLQIPRTDSYLHQKRADVAGLQLLCGHCPVFPPSDVRDMEALEAVKHWRPDVVIASWSVQLGNTVGHSSPWGVDEEKILKRVSTYCLLGTDSVHQHKKIMKLPHKRFELPFLVSRSFAQQGVVYLWEK